MKCPHCGEEVPYEGVKFCPNCGKSLVVKQKARTDLLLVAAMLTIISAAFSAGFGCLAFNSFASYLGLNVSLSAVSGLLIVGVLSIVAAVVGIVAGVFMLKKKNVNFSMLGIIILLVSAFGDYITLYYYGYVIYGFTEIALFCEVTTIIFSILSGILISSSKNEFD